MEEILEFKCWNCQGNFHYKIDRETLPTISIPCPYCKATCRVDFAPYHDKIVDVLRDGQTITLEISRLPAIIPTTE